MPKIQRGRYNVGGGNCHSDNLYTLLEWCLNTKEDVVFDIESEKGYSYYTVITFQEHSSIGKYLLGDYQLYLLADIRYEYKHWYTTLAVDNEYTIDDVVKEFSNNINQVDRYYGNE